MMSVDDVPDDPARAQRRPRRYVSSRRAHQAEQTRADILAAAVKLFASSGWAGTTLAAIAAEADVAVETIYGGYPSKKALLLAAMDVAIVGDAEPVPVREREWIQAIRHLATPAERVRRVAELFGNNYAGPLSGVWLAMLEASASDPEVAAWCEEHERRRRQTMQDFAELALGLSPDPHAMDALWAVGSIEVYLKLTTQRGWSREQWQDWFADLLRRVPS